MSARSHLLLCTCLTGLTLASTFGVGPMLLRDSPPPLLRCGLRPAARARLGLSGLRAKEDMQDVLKGLDGRDQAEDEDEDYSLAPHRRPQRPRTVGASGTGRLSGLSMAVAGHDEEISVGAGARKQDAPLPATVALSPKQDAPPGTGVRSPRDEILLKPKIYPEPIVFSAEGEHTATIIFLHGFNSRGSGRGIDMAQRLNLPWCKIILPQAPVYSVSGPGQTFQSWAELDPLSLGRHAVSVLPDQASLLGSVAGRVLGGQMRVWDGMQELVSGVAVVGPFNRLEGTQEDRLANARYVRNLMESEVRRGIPRERIALIGYSQGGSIALSILFDLGIRVGAFVGLCTWFPTTLESPQEQVKALDGLPCLFCHGTSDLVVPMTLGKKAHEECKNIGMQAKFTVYEGAGHDLPENLKLVKDVRRFLQECLPRVAPIQKRPFQ